VLIGAPDENDPVAKAFVPAFTQTLADLGWTDGRNVRMDVRSFGDDANRIRALARELVDLQPDIIVTGGPTPTAALQRETRTIPIVFDGAALGGDHARATRTTYRRRMVPMARPHVRAAAVPGSALIARRLVESAD
jgi:hypothetical protein